MTKELKCNCEHKFQDETYGKYIRVHNQAGSDKDIKYRCTVCGSVKKPSEIKK